MNPYSTLVDFMLLHASPEAILQFRASEEMHNYAYMLLDKEKSGTATQAELKLINEFVTVEHIMRLAKAKAERHAR